ncbi:MAG: 2-oxo acid dehydrogenase subunit E2, partial [Bacteroidetes bacterium]|nr:2-oxo acid dehydrogenase subunit E2 [Bacteroidota bacterium]
ALEYHEGSLPAAALQDGTFTVTDLSGEDVFSFRPVINHRQSAILGVGAEQPLGGERVFQLSLTFDHRLTEGREAARFLRALRERLGTYEDS